MLPLTVIKSEIMKTFEFVIAIHFLACNCDLDARFGGVREAEIPQNA